ncbi:MAG: acetyl-CoA carboxylase carboxyl transferase subunit alpha/beta [Pseudomonadota bacterium]
MDADQRLSSVEKTLQYLFDVKGGAPGVGFEELKARVERLKSQLYELAPDTLLVDLAATERALRYLQERAEESLTPADIVRISRHPQRVSLHDILENVYDSFTELGGAGDCNIDAAVVVARANISRRVRERVYVQRVMVVGHEKGCGEEFRNGGSAKPWGNEKALRYMRVAETEGMPIHSYIFTPGAFPVEDYPGAAQQIARNIYQMAGLTVPIVSFISEGGSGGAEAIGVADLRLMGSHGYYSVISPEGAAAIEGKIRESEKVPREMVEYCAEQLKITARDNLRMGTISRIVQEPRLGARKDDYEFFQRLRTEMIQATDEVVLSVKRFAALRSAALRKRAASPRKKNKKNEEMRLSWRLGPRESERLVELRQEKYLAMGEGFFQDGRTSFGRLLDSARDVGMRLHTGIYYGLLKKHQKNVRRLIEDVSGEGNVVVGRLADKLRALQGYINDRLPARPRLIDYQPAAEEGLGGFFEDTYMSPLANEDKTISCPNAATHGCYDLWVPDLYGEQSGVCENCGHHFPLEYEWYLKNLFDRDSIREFNENISAINPLGFKGFDAKLATDASRSGRRSSMITFFARVQGIDLIVAMLFSNFRQGTVGAAEGQKFVLACERARHMRRPLLFYVHATGGIRIHEGTIGVVQMPRCTVAVRRYIKAGGLYIVVYDNNSFAGPVASFLGCSSYQFAIKSSRIGFAGPRVIRETTGEAVAPDYHGAENALRRGHIQGIWDRREFRQNLYNAILTMGGENLYYR